MVHDNGNKFTGYAFANLLYALGMKDVPTTSKNPQSNAICKYMNQKNAIMLKTFLLSQPPKASQDVLHLVDDGLVTTT